MFNVIERLLRLTKVWIVRRTHASLESRPASGVSILRTSAPMSASSIPGSSAGATRASSRILIPSSTPIVPLPLLEIRFEARRQRADVGNVLEMTELLGDARRLVRREDGPGARQELLIERRVGQRRVGMTSRAARVGRERAPVAEPDRHAAPRLLLGALGQPGIDDHCDPLHQLAYLGVRDLAVRERGEVHPTLGE